MFEVNLKGLQSVVRSRYGLSHVGEWQAIRNGDECLVWRVEAEPDLIVRVSPAWRTLAELKWTHTFTLHCRQTVPEVVAPVSAGNATVFAFTGHAVTVFPFVVGDTLDIGSAALRENAARILAHIHCAAARWPMMRERPPSKPNHPQGLARKDYPEFILDPELDDWEDSLPELPLTRLPIHGDYYPRNVLATDHGITGIIDWDEAHIGYLMAEIAWTVWEFSQNANGDDLLHDRAKAFVDAYFLEGPPCPRSELIHLVAFVRRRLRSEIVGALAQKMPCEDWSQEHQDYLDAEVRAFSALRGCTL